MSLIMMLCHPITVTFFVIAIGLCIGKIKVNGIALDLAAVLIMAVVTGYLLSLKNSIVDIEQMNSYMKMFSSLGTALFVSVIGITAGYSFNIKSSGKLTSAVMGSAMIISAVLAMLLVSKFDIGISHSVLLGVLCGALTTTPGLSAACEKSNIVAAEASLGYGSAYLFGVIFTVLAVQVLTKNEKTLAEKQTFLERKSSSKSIFDGLLQISLVIMLGRLLGTLTIPYINFSLGNSGGILCTGMLIGYFVAKALKKHRISKERQSIVRNLGLVLFFVGNGVPAGMQIKNNFSVIAIIVGMVLTVIPITLGCFFCKMVLRKNNTDTAIIIAGGMTSTPAIGVLISKNDISCDKYSFAYVGALAAVVFCFGCI